ncbi:MAG: hypothetical protein HC831_16680 [Chloroflexia bacterium]|nr:hypothetical protein [Chloroflexia bacterium]
MEKALERATEKKRRRIFCFSHEILGALSEEMLEFQEEVHHKDMEAVRAELLDIAVVAFWGVASLNQKIKNDE